MGVHLEQRDPGKILITLDGIQRLEDMFGAVFGELFVLEHSFGVLHFLRDEL